MDNRLKLHKKLCAFARLPSPALLRLCVPGWGLHNLEIRRAHNRWYSNRFVFGSTVSPTTAVSASYYFPNRQTCENRHIATWHSLRSTEDFWAPLTLGIVPQQGEGRHQRIAFSQASQILIFLCITGLVGVAGLIKKPNEKKKVPWPWLHSSAS